MTGLRLRLHQTRVLLATQYAYMTEYRAELILWALSVSLSFILMGVWHEASGRADLGITPDEKVIVYHGSVTSANRGDLRKLYLAVALLNRDGIPTHLIPTGYNDSDFGGCMQNDDP